FVERLARLRGVEGGDGLEAGAYVPGVVQGALVGQEVALGVETQAACVRPQPVRQLLVEVGHTRGPGRDDEDRPCGFAGQRGNDGRAGGVADADGGPGAARAVSRGRGEARFGESVGDGSEEL